MALRLVRRNPFILTRPAAFDVLDDSDTVVGFVVAEDVTLGRARYMASVPWSAGVQWRSYGYRTAAAALRALEEHLSCDPGAGPPRLPVGEAVVPS